MSAVKLSKAQAEVVAKMEDGWELGQSLGIDVRYWLQKGGCGRGGEVKSVSYATVHALLKKDVIKAGRRHFPVSVFTLTGKHKAAIQAAERRE